MIAAADRTRRDHQIAVALAMAGGILAILVRWYYVIHVQVLQPLDLPNARADAVDYYRYAWNLAHHATFSSDLPGSDLLRPSSYRDPGYPALLAALMLVTDRFETWYAVVLLTQAALGGVAVTALVLAMSRRLPNVLLAAVTILLVVWPHSVAMTAYVLSENLVACLVAVSFLLLRRADRRRTLFSYAACGLVLGLAGLTNAVLAPVGLLIALVLAWHRLAPGRALVVLAACSLALPAAWGIRNIGMPFESTAGKRASMNLVEGSWPTFHAAYQLAMKGDEAGMRTVESVNREIAAFDESTGNGLATLCRRMCPQPLTYLAWYAQKPIFLWGWDIQVGQGDIYVYPTRGSPFRSLATWRGVEDACFMLNPLIMLLAAVGVLSSLVIRPTGAVECAMGAMAISVTAIYAALQAEPRYAVPFRGIEVGLAALGLMALMGLRHARRKAPSEIRVADRPG